MTNDRLGFYREVVGTWLPDPSVSLLVVGAEENDRDVFSARGFCDVTLLNLGDWTAPLPEGWKYVRGTEDRLPFPDRTFGTVLAHATLHHCRSPHRMLLEMYRVAKARIVFIEARDSLLMRTLTALGFTQEYETTAVHYNEGTRGGVDDTAVPNYVYRWTERDTMKTIQSYAPHQEHDFYFRYGLALPETPAARTDAPVRAALVKAVRPVARLLGAIMPRQQNLFAACIVKPDPGESLKPWIRMAANGAMCFDRSWGNRHYKPGCSK